MNNKINNYLLSNFFKTLLNCILLAVGLGLILNLFEEVEFFKNSNESLFLPVLLTLSYIPNLIFINLMPFIIFISAMWFFVSIKHNNELLTLKVFGYSNIKIISLISVLAFLWGIFILLVINPVTADMVKYYEKTKSNYSTDTDHLITINRNGVWIKERKGNDLYIINSNRLVKQRIESKKANIQFNKWILEKPKIFKFDGGDNISTEQREKLEFNSFYNVEKLNNLFRNLDTISFVDLLTENKKFVNRGYEKITVSEKINSFFALPFFLSLMVILAGVFTINNRNANNINYLMIAVLSCAIIYYMKDLSVALGKSDRISPEISVWIPVIIISLINSIGLLQINEK